jgi:putative ABC transport system permease protein
VDTILQHVWCELRRRKARTLTTMLGYGLAVASMMVLVGVLQVSGQGSAGILDHTGTHFVAFSPADMAACGPCIAVANSQIQSEGLVAFGTRTNLMPHAFVDRIKGLSTVTDAAPCLQYRFRDPNDGHLYTVGGFDPQNTMVVGTTCCAATDVLKGRFLVEGDKGKVLLEQAYAQLRRLDVGSAVRIADQTFTVLGIINPGIRPAKADIYMPYTQAEQLVASQLPNVPLSGHANLILVEVKDSSVQDQAIREVKSLYPDLVISSYACYRPAAQARAINTTAITLLVMAIGVFTVLLAMASQLSVLVERRRELSILKTLGFSNGRIMGQIVLESVVQAAVGASVAGLFVLLLMPWLLVKGLVPMGVPVSDIRGCPSTSWRSACPSWAGSWPACSRPSGQAVSALPVCCEASEDSRP